MSNKELIDLHASADQCKKALVALSNHALKVAKKREESELLPGKEEFVWLVLTVKKTFPEKKLKPFKIPLVHPLVDPRTTPICLITKDPQREYKDLLEKHNIKFISRVVGITKLKGKFKPFEARRLLLKENGLFLADERVIPLLPALLGKKFFEAKKQPIPVCLTRKDLKGELERAISSTYMHQNQGTCSSVKIGRVQQKPAELLANLKSALPAIVKNIKGGWENVQSLNVKTNSSVSLPIWSCELGQGENARWEDVGDEDAEEWAGFGSIEDSANQNTLGPKEEGAPGKKRAAEEKTAPVSKKAKQTNEPTSKSNTTEPDIGDASTLSRKASKARKSVNGDASEDAALPSGSKTSTSSSKPPPELVKRNPKGSRREIKMAESDSRSSAAPKAGKADKATKQTTDDETLTSASEISTKHKKVLTSIPTGETTSSLSSADLKQKRSGDGLERKKAKIMQGKTKRGAKESILGSAAKSRL
ncbi:ribosomal protein L1 [Rickenella mellea]|uniref:Ribosomal L1 domain-containing protein 1 n=1 Tax=Rickenella mellea TaxID=50990 RepID=A0A4Y7Q4U0_9AGAM|nr:ribosomal protein L1 [Rickenella mellea]